MAEERRGVDSQEQLSREARGTGPERGARALKRNGEAGQASPEKANMGGDQLGMAPYQRGMVMAPPAHEKTKPPAEGLKADKKSYEVPQQSVHVAALDTREASEQTCSGTGLRTAAEPADRVHSGAKKEFERIDLGGQCLGSLGQHVYGLLLGVLPLRSKDTGIGSRDEIFPLPTSRSSLLDAFPGLTDEQVFWCMSLCLSLNSFWGGEVVHNGPVTGIQRDCLELLILDIKRFANILVEVPVVDWKELFGVRSIDYKGDEVKVAKWFGWANVGAALPSDVGSVALEDVCTLGCRHYVLHFDEYIKPASEWGPITKPKVMVADPDWADVCTGLVTTGVCEFILEEDVFQTSAGPLLNGMFGVSKDETTADGTDIHRLIMNLVPLNALCKPISGDVDTLPSWSGMNPFFLQPNEQLLVSSEDVKCFFYTMSVPRAWTKYLAFNKLVPDRILPPSLQGRRVYVASRVLPMGFLNSVSLAQHVHRNLVAWSSEGMGPGDNAPAGELRKDRSFTVHNPAWRVYLDNYDLLERVKKCEVSDLEGTCAAGVLSLRQQYELWKVPRNVKKAVERSSLCELQGATVDGQSGVAYPRESKLAKYVSLALDLCQRTYSTQKQWQVVCGGLVYFSMFRRPLLGSLNQVWQHILSYDRLGKYRQETPHDCRLEVLRFVGLLPLARLDFRLDVHPMVTCSDASSYGGGLCATTGLTNLGGMVAQGSLRGEVPEAGGDLAVFSIGLFDGIAALRVALEVINVKVLGHVSVESNLSAQRVVEAHFPGVECVTTVQEVNEDMVKSWACRYSQCSLVLIGAGPPCQGVSGLNPDRKGALKDERSCLFSEVPRIQHLVRMAFPWCPVHTLMESVGSMDSTDRSIMSAGFGDEPLLCDAGTLTWCHRPRLYWLTWEVDPGEGAQIDSSGEVKTLILHGQQAPADVLRAGWRKVDETRPFPTFTTSRPRGRAGRKPAGVHQCSLAELERWHLDCYRFPPYQYKESNSLVNSAGQFRVPDVGEREVMMGFPLHYTAQCANKVDRKKPSYNDQRLTLLGNSWSVPVVAWLLSQLFAWLGWIRAVTPQEVLDACRAGGHDHVQGRLARLPLNPSRKTTEVEPYELAFKLSNLVSVKGEDIMLNAPSSQLPKFQRLRASVPSRLWKWKIIAGWHWKHTHEHINALELRAIFTSLRWRIEKQRQTGCRMIHLTDSHVCLHVLSRGRSSSRKLRRTMARVNALVLASNVQAVWSYVHTDDNPADRPSRWARRVKTKFRHAS